MLTTKIISNNNKTILTLQIYKLRLIMTIYNQIEEARKRKKRKQKKELIIKGKYKSLLMMKHKK